jgi:phytanoyl-CoA hydroxylase
VIAVMEDLKTAYDRDGFVWVRGLLTPYLDDMRASLGIITDLQSQTWLGPWLQSGEAVAIYSGHFNAGASPLWMTIVNDPSLQDVCRTLLAGPVELAGATMVTKPPRVGQPFPLHQDDAFYPKPDGRYVIAIVYLDDVTPENGGVRVLPGSHRQGPIPHVTAPNSNKKHLPLDRYRLEDTVEPPAQAGDVLFFHIWTVHGSYPNRSGSPRRTVRLGFQPEGTA